MQIIILSLSKVKWHKALIFILLVLFIILYIISAYLYPGGNQHDALGPGFSIMHNYWCDMFRTPSINQMDNPGVTFGLAASFVMAILLMCFFFVFPKYFSSGLYWDKLIQIMGMTSMIFALCITTSLHDYAIGVASIVGLGALIGIFVGLHKNAKTKLFLTGLFCVLLIIVNNYLYYFEYYYYLPLLQKLTLVLILFWLACLSYSFKQINRFTN